MKEIVQHEYRAGAESHWWMRARRSIFRRILRECVKPPDGAHVLDVGPGFGVNTEVLAECGSVSVLDTSIESLTDCRRRGASRLVYGDAQAPPLRDRVVDLVCALDVLEHLDEDTAALAAWRELLRDDGRLLLTVPALPLLWGRQDVLAGHRRRYRKRDLQDRLRAAGFVVERLSYFNTVLFLPILAVRLCMRPFLARTRTGGGGSDFSVPSFGLNGLLYRLFAAEGPWLAKRDLPMGVSLLCVARKGALPEG